MSIFLLLTLLPSLALAGLATATLAQISLLPKDKLRSGVLFLAGAGAALIAGAVVATVGTGAGNHYVIPASPAYSLVVPLRPAFLAVLLVGLFAVTLTDLRERMVLARLISIPVLCALAIAALNIPFFGGGPAQDVFSLILVITGMIVCWGVSAIIGLFGQLWVRLRAVPPDFELAEILALEDDGPALSELLAPFGAVVVSGLAAGGVFASGLAAALVPEWLLAAGLAWLAIHPHQLSELAPRWPGAKTPASGGDLADRAEISKKAPDTGQIVPPTEGFSTGDVLLMVLVGALLGPAMGIVALGAGVIINGLFALPVFLYDLATGRKEARSIPMVPSLCLGTLIALLIMRP